MKKIMLLVVITAVIAFYALPVYLANAEVNKSPNKVPYVANSVFRLRITAYASEEAETDDTPFVTANGTYVHDGIVATNLLPFGTRVQIPDLFGDKIFTVEDRMNARIKNGMDIWMSSRKQALYFGANYADVVVLGKENNAPTVKKDSAIVATIAR